MNLGFKTNVALINLWVWVDVEWFWDCWNTYYYYEVVDFSSWFAICPHTWISRFFLMKISILVDFYFLTCYASFFGSRGDGNPEWWVIFISIINLEFLVLMTMFLHRRACTKFTKDWLPLLGFILLCLTRQDTKGKDKFMGAQFRRTTSLVLMLYTPHALTNWNMWLFTNLYAQDA